MTFSRICNHSLCLLLLAAGGASARADARLPRILSDHMVLQRDVAVPVWGWADPGEEVVVAFAGQTKTTKAGGDGRWMVRLDALKAGGVQTLTVKAKNTIEVKDVLVGEVWLASGQSNMGMTVSRARDFEKEKAAASDAEIRMFQTPIRTARSPLDDCEGKWVVCSPETVGGFSATAYFFGRELRKSLGIPVGLINTSYGGTPIEAWISLESQKSRPEFANLLAEWDKRAVTYDPSRAMAAYQKQLAAHKKRVADAKAQGKQAPRAPRKPVDPRDEQHHPAVLYNAMIAPLAPYAVRGAIWYQGESNCGREMREPLYGLQLRTLVAEWRGKWGQGDFPFAWVQLPNYDAGGSGRGWSLVREAMLDSLTLPNSGMAVAIDVGEPKDIHPKNKQEVGRRLGLWARARVYGETISYSGPLLAGCEVANGTITLTFKHADGGLRAGTGAGDSAATLKGFEILDNHKKWLPASARIEGDKVVVSSPEVAAPVAARYDWGGNPAGNLYNGAGLPASPFRTEKR